MRILGPIVDPTAGYVASSHPPAPEAILPTASELTYAAVTTSVAYAGLQLPWDLGNA